MLFSSQMSGCRTMTTGRFTSLPPKFTRRQYAIASALKSSGATPGSVQVGATCFPDAICQCQGASWQFLLSCTNAAFVPVLYMPAIAGTAFLPSLVDGFCAIMRGVFGVSPSWGGHGRGRNLNMNSCAAAAPMTRGPAMPNDTRCPGTRLLPTSSSTASVSTCASSASTSSSTSSTAFKLAFAGGVLPPDVRALMPAASARSYQALATSSPAHRTAGVTQAATTNVSATAVFATTRRRPRRPPLDPLADIARTSSPHFSAAG
mmetsp:Transcript_4766/g.19027  ORF Transcript_4766/g.19027 Transcript_4766/m.19027 type:complete len:262 (+) Transcript_4766:2260-3045(+)